MNLALTVRTFLHIIYSDDADWSWQAAQEQIDRAKVLKSIVTSAVDIYSFVDAEDEDEVRNLLQHQEYIIIRIALQTIECGIFIQHYASNAGKWLILSYAPGDWTSFHFTPTSPTSNLGHAENGIIALEGACATQGGAWIRAEIANAVRIGSSIPGSRYGVFSPLVCPGLDLTHESQFKWKH
jgi:hypothetical protein